MGSWQMLEMRRKNSNNFKNKRAVIKIFEKSPKFSITN